MSARAVAVIRPAPTIIALLAFLCILSGQRQLHAYEEEFGGSIGILRLFSFPAGMCLALVAQSNGQCC
jgi:hypothetical protein